MNPDNEYFQDQVDLDKTDPEEQYQKQEIINEVFNSDADDLNVEQENNDEKYQNYENDDNNIFEENGELRQYTETETEHNQIQIQNLNEEEEQEVANSDLDLVGNDFIMSSSNM